MKKIFRRIGLVAITVLQIFFVIALIVSILTLNVISIINLIPFITITNVIRKSIKEDIKLEKYDV